MYGGAHATGHSAMANDTTALAHRRRNPGESLRGGPTLSEPAVPPIAIGHEHEPIRRGTARTGNSDRPEHPDLSARRCRACGRGCGRRQREHRAVRTGQVVCRRCRVPGSVFVSGGRRECVPWLFCCKSR
jgi:hypothetical protein